MKTIVGIYYRIGPDPVNFAGVHREKPAKLVLNKSWIRGL